MVGVAAILRARAHARRRRAGIECQGRQLRSGAEPGGDRARAGEGDRRGPRDGGVHKDAANLGRALDPDGDVDRLVGRPDVPRRGVLTAVGSRQDGSARLRLRFSARRPQRSTPQEQEQDQSHDGLATALRRRESTGVSGPHWCALHVWLRCRSPCDCRALHWDPCGRDRESSTDCLNSTCENSRDAVVGGGVGSVVQGRSTEWRGRGRPGLRAATITERKKGEAPVTGPRPGALQRRPATDRGR